MNLSGSGVRLRKMVKEGRLILPVSSKVVFPPDAQIIRRIRANDQEAEELLVRKYGQSLLITGIQTGLSEADAEEVVSDVFLSALEQARDGKLGPNVGPWLRKVTTNRAIDRRRHNRTVWEREAIVAEELYHIEYRQEEEHKTVYPYDLVILKRAMQVIQQQDKERTGSKPESHDSDILNWIAHGVTNEQLAEYLGVNENTARQRRLRALRRLKQEYERL